jgi:hypothetical protein
MKKNCILGCVMLAAITLTASGQSSTKSPYSQFGIGVLSDRSQGMSRGMNGVGVGLRSGTIVNTLNPASYSAVDSLSMLFDAGLAGQITNFEEGRKRQNASTANFEYIVGLFRAWRNIGVAVGMLPISNIGYSYSSSNYIDANNGTVTSTFSGEGGLHEAFVGIGWQPLKPLSVGANIGYVWGDLSRTVLTTGTSSSMATLSRLYSSTVKSYKADFGIQWHQPLSKQDRLTMGATLSIGHKLGADPELNIINTTTSDTTSFRISDGLELPWSWSVGAAYNHSQKLTIAADMEMQLWSKAQLPSYDSNMNTYRSMSGLTRNRMRLGIGADWSPNPMSRKYLNRVHYRIGTGLTTPYYKINNQDGPKEFSASLGFGLPIQNGYNNRSVVNVSAQWVHASAHDFITENTFRINIGITFNERWFAKWKVE